MTTFDKLEWKEAELALEQVDRACRDLKIDYYLLGAQAVKFHSSELEFRVTRDFDLAVMIPDLASFDTFKIHLTALGFVPDHQEPYRLFFSQNHLIIDLLPFGEIEKDGKVKFDNKLSLSVIGLREVNRRVSAHSIDGKTIRIAEPDGLFLLKLLSWQDKPERLKDLDDMFILLKNYFDQNQNRFYADHLNLVDDLRTQSFMLEAGASMLGIDLHALIAESETILSRLKKIFKKELSNNSGPIGAHFVQKDYFKTLEDFQRVFSLIFKHLI